MDKIINEINKSQNILLHCHPSPDPDSVGSTLAMKFALEQIGKKVTLIRGDSEIPKSFVFPGIDTITPKNFFEIDLSQFDTFLILDSGGLEMISTKDTILFPESLVTIVIDHHASNKGYGKFNLVDTSYSSTAQLVFDIISKMNIEINHDIALNLFMGIYTDTGAFRYGINSVKTLEIASRLAGIAPDYQKTISIMENSNRKESLIFEGLALSSLQIYNKLAIVSISNSDLIKNNIKEQDIYTGSISNKIKSIIGIEISATFVEIEPNLVKISFRAREYDVSKIASILGGGGHKLAAGVKLKTNISDAIEKVVKTIKDLYNL